MPDSPAPTIRTSTCSGRSLMVGIYCRARPSRRSRSRSLRVIEAASSNSARAVGEQLLVGHHAALAVLVGRHHHDDSHWVSPSDRGLYLDVERAPLKSTPPAELFSSWQI